jgi:hypothetical protein
MKNLPNNERSKEQPKNTNNQYHNQEAENKDKQGRTEQDEKLNDSLKDQGMDTDEAAAIANTQDAGESAEGANVYENMSMEDLYTKAKEAGIDGYYDMRKGDIVMALKQDRDK